MTDEQVEHVIQSRAPSGRADMGETNTGLRSVLSTPVVYEHGLGSSEVDHGRSTLVARARSPAHRRPGARPGLRPGRAAALPRRRPLRGRRREPRSTSSAPPSATAIRAQFLVGDATAIDRRPRRVRPGDRVRRPSPHRRRRRAAAVRPPGAPCAPGGRMVTVDPTCSCPGRARGALRSSTRDRGQHVREPERLRAARRGDAFDEVTTTVRSDLLRIPYTHCVLECTAAGPRVTTAIRECRRGGAGAVACRGAPATCAPDVRDSRGGRVPASLRSCW